MNSESELFLEWAYKNIKEQIKESGVGAIVI